MSNFSENEYRQSDFCQPEQGLDYIFGKMGAIYGAAFMRHWDGVDINLVRQTWMEILGRYTTYRPIIDWALNHMNPDYPPSALAFKELCLKMRMRIPEKPNTIITKQLTEAEKQVIAKNKAEALAKMAEFSKAFKQKNVNII